MNEERKKLVSRLKALYAIIRVKQEEYQKENNLGPEVGYLTRESFVVASLIPEMGRLGINFNEIC